MSQPKAPLSTLTDLIRDQATSVEQIGQWLDRLDPEARKREIRSLASRDIRELYGRAASSHHLTLEDFVPPGTPEGQEVIHWGRNSLPAFNDFEKRFARVPGRSDQVMGYNEQSMRWITGPGYFLAHSTSDHPEWRERGGVVINYFLTPEAGTPVPAGWPTIRPNHFGVQILIYYHTRDFMRRVSQHVTVGAAYKGESTKEMGAYFVLCREG